MGRITRITSDHRRIVDVLAPLTLGIVAAFLVVGVDGMDPTNVGWCQDGDGATHVLGWEFFRNEPWRVPLGANTSYGLELGSSIFYSDSLPLLALAFKPFTAWLPTPFQYFGIWVALSLVLQSWFAWKLMGQVSVTQGTAFRSLAVGLFVFSPPMLHRIGGHSTLVGHWLILAALTLCLDSRRCRLRYAWVALVSVASLIHAYLFVMVTALWVVDALRRTLFVRERRGAVLLEALLVLSAAALCLWQSGFFMISVSSGGGYGVYGMNVLAPLAPGGFSRIIKPLTTELAKGSEGYNFLGLGNLALLLMIAPALLARPSLLGIRKELWPLVAMLCALTLFSFSHEVTIGDLHFTVPLPVFLVEAAGPLRSSGRMFWPAYYMLIFWLIRVLAAGHEKRVAHWLLAGAVGLQIYDTSVPWRAQHAQYTAVRSDHWPTPLKSPFWSLVGSKYRRVRGIPIKHPAPNFAVFADYAARHHMATDMVYLARVDPNALMDLAQDSEAIIQAGAFDPDTLYILDETVAKRAAQTLDVSSDFLTRVDGFIVLAPGLKRQGSEDAAHAYQSLSLQDLTRPLVARQVVSVAAKGGGLQYLGVGWSDPEPWGVWAHARDAELSIAVDPREHIELLRVRAGALLGASHPEQVVECWLNGVSAATLHFTLESNSGWRDIRIPPQAQLEMKESGVLHARFHMKNPAIPKVLGLNEDTRELGMALHDLELAGAAAQ